MVSATNTYKIKSRNFTECLFRGDIYHQKSIVSMQTNFLCRKYWLLALVVFLFAGASPCLALSQTVQKPEVCNVEVCYVKLTQTGFSPERIVVREGSTVIWKNLDSNMHMISGGTVKGPLLFNSSILSKGDDYAFTFRNGSIGEFRYFDQGENSMKGEILVVSQIPENVVREVSIDFTDPSSGIKKVSLVHGRVIATAAMPDFQKLMISVDLPPTTPSTTPSQNMITITIDRTLIDSLVAGKDAPFVVLVDGRSESYSEIHPTPLDRTLVVPITQGTKNVIIVGNYMSSSFMGYKEAQAALDSAEKVITRYRNSGIVLSHAEDVLLKARDAFSFGKYLFAVSLAKEATNLATSTNETARAANEAMNLAETSINATKTLGLKVPEAEKMLQRTREMYVYGGYDDALALAVQAKIAANDTTNQLYTITGIAGVSAAWVIMYLRLRRRNMPRVEPNVESKQVLQGTLQGSEPRSDISDRNPTYHIPIISNVPATVNDIAATATPPHPEQLRIASTQPSSTAADLNKVFAEKPHLRMDDRKVLKYVIEQNGEALLAEIRNRFSLPKSTAWRLVKRLEREELVEIVKFGNQNLIRCRLRKQS
jgi:uncharacterized membrane protein/plastocyanin